MPNTNLPGTPNLDAILARGRKPEPHWFNKYVLNTDWKYWLAIIPIIIIAFFVIALMVYAGAWIPALIVGSILGLAYWLFWGIEYLKGY